MEEGKERKASMSILMRVNVIWKSSSSWSMMMEDTNHHQNQNNDGNCNNIKRRIVNSTNNSTYQTSHPNNTQINSNLFFMLCYVMLLYYMSCPSIDPSSKYNTIHSIDPFTYHVGGGWTKELTSILTTWGVGEIRHWKYPFVPPLCPKAPNFPLSRNNC